MPTQDQRRYYLQAAREGAWSVRHLRESIAADRYGEAVAPIFATGVKTVSRIKARGPLC